MSDNKEKVRASTAAYALDEIMHERDRPIYRSGQQAKVFLLPAFDTPRARACSLLECATLLRLAIAPAVRAADDHLAFYLLTMAQELEAEGSAAVCKDRSGTVDALGGLSS